MNPWLFLLAAIVTEVMGTSVMKLASGEAPITGHLAMYVLITLSYYCLARAVEHIPLGVAYALWEALGLLLIALVGLTLFAESLSLWQWLGMLLLLSGIALLKVGTRDSADEQGEAS
ncbi:SMR family transporter [Alloalcanivorax xenomutans]|uniref:Spermidine export protein MdtJ n=1 Tax=Alcanivorax xiamenensis TaxID=1177156 RepID=A0ABQ6Y5M1_9GAMM|nr:MULTISPECIES: multidrug efflux SMR transporter [Alcanivoracaceae]KAF0804334.1 SMR family multidrug efflux pump [Alcanivorax xiamenensis]SOC00536.1 spermidine export protein MdtJ [Alloalcanivorax xenomutans]